MRFRKGENTKTLREAGCEVKVHRVKNGDRIQFQLAYYEGGKRRRPKFADGDTAFLEAQTVLARLISGEHAALHLKGDEKQIYTLASQRLSSEFPGCSLLEAVEEFVAAKKLLPEDTSLKEAAREFAARHALEPRTPCEVLSEMVEAKQNAGLSSAYLKDFKRLEKFGAAFSCPLMQITAQEIESFLNSLKSSPKTKNNYRRLIKTLFNFASSRGYAPKNYDIMESVNKAKEFDKEIEVFTPSEMQEILKVARNEMIPFLSIAAFSGLRTAEIKRLDWEAIDLSEGVIRVTGKVAKTASSRLAPIPSNLQEWLLPYRKNSGPVTPFANTDKQMKWIVEDINAMREETGNQAAFRWKHNGLRHSFISYRQADIQNISRVADEAGNSPGPIYKHYRQLVTKSAAGEWFSLRPNTCATSIIKLSNEVQA